MRKLLPAAAVVALMLGVGSAVAQAAVADAPADVPPAASGAHGGEDNGEGHGEYVTDENADDVEVGRLQAAVVPLATDCKGSNLAPHNGFQDAPTCVSTAFGEVSDAPNNPTLLITGAPATVEDGQDFELQVSTRNLVRDRFLGAAAGGYYLETSLLNEAGLQRGHFHVACRVLASVDEAPNPDVVPEFFQAVEDGAGGAAPDTVTLTVPGTDADGDLFTAGDLVQCAAWAGDGSHRIPMMERANETPAFDAVRIRVE